MSIFPNVNINSEIEQVLPDSQIGRAFLVDSDGKLVIRDGKLVVADKKLAAQQWIALFLRTKLDKYNVYKGTDFGMLDLYNLRGRSIIASNYMQAEMKREITEKLEKCKFIRKIDNVQLEFSGHTMVISLTTTLEDGEVIVNEVEL